MPWNVKNIFLRQIPPPAERIVYTLVYLFVSCFVSFLFFEYSGVNESPLARFSDMINGTAAQPFVYRTLVPWIVQGVLFLLPIGVQGTLHNLLSQSQAAQQFFVQSGWARQVDTQLFPLESLLVMGIITACFLGCAVVIRQLLQQFYPQASRIITTVFPLIVLFSLPVFFMYGYIYDAPTLFLFTLALFFMYRKEWAKYVVIFLLACLNKETSILLLMTFLIHFFSRKRLDRKKYLTLALGQFSVYMVICVILSLFYSQNPDSFLNFHLLNSILFLPSWLTFRAQIVVAIIGALLFYNWSKKPPFLKAALWMFVPLFIFTLPFSGLDEIRVFYEVYPVIMLLLFPSLVKLITGKDILARA